MKKKIAIISNVSWNLYNFRLSLMIAMRDNGYEVVAIAPYDRYSQKIIDEGFEFHDIKMNAQGTNFIEDMKTTYNFYKLFKEISPDIICQYTIKPNIYGSFAAALLNIKTINNIAGLGTLFIKETFVTKVAKSLYKASQHSAEKVFFQNREDYNFFTTQGIINKNKCDILPGSGVDTIRFSPKEKSPSERVRFLFIARMIWEKGIAEYVEAARIIKKKHENVEFCMLGFLEVENPGAVTKHEMNEWVDEGIINYLGISDKVCEVIHTADCVVLPSYYREGTPKTLLESGSSGKPLITTDSIGCRDVVDDGVNGYLCKPRSSQDLANKLEMFLNLSDNEKSDMGDASRRKMKDEFDEKLVIEKYLGALNEIVSKETISKSKIVHSYANRLIKRVSLI